MRIFIDKITFDKETKDNYLIYTHFSKEVIDLLNDLTKEEPTAGNLTNSVSTEVKEQESMARISKEMSAIDTEIAAGYTQIGRKYVDYVIKNQEVTGLDVTDLLKMLEPKLARKAELDAELIKIQKRLKDMALLQEKTN